MAGSLRERACFSSPVVAVLQEELANRTRMSPATPQWHPDLRSSHCSSPLLRSHSPQPWLRGWHSGPTLPHIHVACGCQEQGLSTFPKAPAGCTAQPPPRRRLVQADPARTAGLHTLPSGRHCEHQPRAAHPSQWAPKGREQQSLYATQALCGSNLGDRSWPRTSLEGAISAPHTSRSLLSPRL